MQHTARLATEKAVFRPALPLCSSLPEFTGEHMTNKKPSYSELLKDPRWQKRRLEILSRDNFTCQRCRDDESTLHVHHKHYHKGRMPWDYEDRELVTLCEFCHEGIDEEDSRLKDVLAFVPMDGPWSRSEAISLLAGWAYLGSKSQPPELLGYFNEDQRGFRVGEVAAFIAVLSAEELRGLLDILERPDRLDTLRAFIGQNKKA